MRELVMYLFMIRLIQLFGIMIKAGGIIYAVSGDQQGYNNPTVESINIEPEGYFEFYSIIMLDTSESGLQDKCELAEELILSGFDYNYFTGLPSLPYFVSVEDIYFTSSALIKWIML